MELDEYRASILSFLFEKLPIGSEVDSLEFSLSGAFGGKYLVAHAAIEHAAPPARIVFTLPTYTRSVFLALTRTRPNETARILANLEDYEREASIKLGLGEAVVTPDLGPIGADVPFAVILLRTATSLDCAAVPDCQDFDDKHTLFFLAVPLSKEEWDVRHQHGHDALMDKFQVDQKELFF